MIDTRSGAGMGPRWRQQGQEVVAVGPYEEKTGLAESSPGAGHGSSLGETARSGRSPGGTPPSYAAVSCPGATGCPNSE